jgi:cytidine deaminase
MNETNLTPGQGELVEAAQDIIRLRFKQDYHHVGAALRTRSGKVFAAVHLEANVGRIAVCAEAVAIGMAAAAGDTDIETIVAVSEDGRVVSPCGMCRELISDYAPQATVIVPDLDQPDRPMPVSVASLLPNKYR